MESIQPGLETVGSLKIPVDEDIDPLERAPKENKDVELGEEEAIVVVTATWSISSVTPIQQNLPPISIHLFIHLLKKAVIKRQEEKLLVRKWRKCWKIAVIK